MLIENLKTEFYDLLLGNTILAVVNYDIDAICATKILQSLFQFDNLMYSVIPVFGKAGLLRAFNENKSNVNNFILVNCGGCIDIVDFLQPAVDITVFVCDSHRPLHVCNVYSDAQVRVICDLSNETNIPAFDSIFSNPDLSLQENSETGRRTETIHKSSAWENERDRILFQYLQYNFYGRSSSVLIFELAWILSKDSIEILWWAIVGITEQFLMGKIERSNYALEIENVQKHINRLSHNRSNNEKNMLNIHFESDLNLVLYRHWSVQESMRYSMNFACKLKLWKINGEKKLCELLVEMGLPIVHSKQKFRSMENVLRQEFYHMVKKLAAKHGVPDLVYGSFVIDYGYRNQYSAADYVYSILAILEAVKKERNTEKCFLEALDSLSQNNTKILLYGLNSAQLLLETIFREVQNTLEGKEITSNGTFYSFVLKKKIHSKHTFLYPHGFIMLAKFMLNAFESKQKQQQYAKFPLIAACTVDDVKDLCLVVGIPPLRAETAKNLFGKAFEQAALESGCVILQDFFDDSFIHIQKPDLIKFLNALTVILA